MAWHITFYACLHKRTGNSFAILENRSILTRDACKMIFLKLTLRLFSSSLWPVVLCCLLKHIEQDPDVLWYFDGCFMVAQREAWCDLSWARDTACEEEEEEVENDDQIWTQIIIEYLSRVVFFLLLIIRWPNKFSRRLYLWLRDEINPQPVAQFGESLSLSLLVQLRRDRLSKTNEKLEFGNGNWESERPSLSARCMHKLPPEFKSNN